MLVGQPSSDPWITLRRVPLYQILNPLSYQSTIARDDNIIPMCNPSFNLCTYRSRINDLLKMIENRHHSSITIFMTTDGYPIYDGFISTAHGSVPFFTSTTVPCTNEKRHGDS